MPGYIPVSDPPPPDDFHTWARPASPDCPDCPCCTLALCQRARDKHQPCEWVSPTRPGYMDVSKCPCAPLSAAFTPVGVSRG